MTIKAWPGDERRRERLREHDPQVLSAATPIVLFLRAGSAGPTALDLGRDALACFGGLGELLAARLRN